MSEERMDSQRVIDELTKRGAPAALPEMRRERGIRRGRVSQADFQEAVTAPGAR